MNALLDFAYVAAAERFGSPVSIDRWTEKHKAAARPQLTPPRRVVGEQESIIKWHYWGEWSAFDWPRCPPGVLRGWRKASGYWTSAHITCMPLVELCTSKHIVTLIDVRRVEGLSASKSDLDKHESLDEFIAYSRPGLIQEIDAANIDRFLGCEELHILGDEPRDRYSMYLWDGRIFLGNSGGSHRFAAARFIAGKLQLLVPLIAKLTVYSIDLAAISQLRSAFDIYAISNDSVVLNEFCDAMQSFEAAYFWNELPRQYEGAQAVFLPKSEKRSQVVAQRLADSGFFDIGAHLGDLANQSRHNVPEDIAALL